jgi:acyl carrier protein
MELSAFVAHFAAQFEDTPAEVFGAETKFRDVNEWDSLIALAVIALADDEYGVKLTGDEIRKSETIADIFAIIKSKKG